MNLFQWILKNVRLDDNHEVDMQFSMSSVCILGIIVALLGIVFYTLLGFYEALYLMVGILILFICLLIYGRRYNNRRAYTTIYVALSFCCAFIHIFLTYYLGDCGTVFLVVAALMAPHMYKLLKTWQVLLLDIFLVIVINLVYLLSLNHIPVYADMVRAPFRLVITNIGLLICLFVLYVNISSQDYIKITRQKMIEKASAAAVLDTLTGLGNRRLLEQHRSEVESAYSEEYPLCVAIFDIDFFKTINDTYGHAEGDRVLEFTAKVMKDFFRKTDLLIRWGGEEFLLLLRHTSFEDAVNIIERFRHKINNMPIIIKGKAVNIHLTIGLKEHHPGVNLEDTIKRADELMYLGKMQGRNRVISEKIVS